MTTPAAERDFALFLRGERRDQMLARFRDGARLFTNPDTGAPFTETEIATATAEGGRYWLEADAIDLVLMAEQQRALFLADQVRPDRATDTWLVDYHGELWGEAPLDATGGTGPVLAKALPGTVWTGSTTIGDPAAVYGTDAKGLRYQILQNKTTLNDGTVSLTVVGIDTGEQTNLEIDDVITWANPPVNAESEAAVTADFTGGTNQETAEEFGKRLIARIRHKPAAGNQSHIRSWARASSNSIEDAVVYPCALNAGSVVVAVWQKRGGVEGPNARVANLSTLTAATSYLVPKLSPVMPARAHVVVVPHVPVPSNALLRLSMARGAATGWADSFPFPSLNAVGGVVSSITVITTQSDFRIWADDANLPAGVSAPKLMVWNPATSRFVQLQVQQVTKLAPNDYRVQLTAPPSFTVAVGDYISPFTAKLAVIDKAIEAYFDELGPGEVIDLTSDERAHRAFRFPEPHEEWPYKAGSPITTRVTDAVGFALSDALLVSMSVQTPAVPSVPILGPNMIVPGKVAVYAG